MNIYKSAEEARHERKGERENREGLSPLHFNSRGVKSEFGARVHDEAL